MGEVGCILDLDEQSSTPNFMRFVFLDGGSVLARYRSRIQIIAEILEVVRAGARKTHIMYKANVNCSVLKEYLDFLMQQNLIEERTVGKKRIVYATTERGLTVLRYFRELKTVLPIVEEEYGKRLPPSLY